MLHKRLFLFFVSFVLLTIGVSFLATKRIEANSILLQENFDDNNVHDNQPISWEEIFDNGNWVAQNGKYVGSIDPGAGVNPRTLAGDLSWDNYAFEAKLTSVSGVDRHILFRFDQNRPIPKGYAIKYRDAESGFSGHIELQKAGLTVLESNDLFKSHLGETHTIRVESIGNHIKIFADNQKYIDYIDNSNPILTGRVGLLIESSGSGLINTTNYDDVVVWQISTFSDEVPTPVPSPTPAPTPSSTPSPTPSPTPTPAATPLNLNVPNLKQYTLPWSDDIYDTATLWSTDPTISRWGCALTSASMVLKYYGHNINPDGLNNWLKSQIDGYLGNGLVNWLAISRYTKQNDSVNSPSLEYRRLGNSLSNLYNEITSGRPAILKLPGHFVVGKGRDESNFLINDPATTKSTLADYANSYLALNQYTPSHTDLSYLMLTIDPTYTLKVFNPNGQEITGSYFIDEPIIDDVEGNFDSGGSIGVFLFPVPPDGNYNVEVAGPPGTYALNSYIYDEDGNVTKNSFDSIIGIDQIDKFQLTYSENPDTTRSVTIASIIEDWNNIYRQGGITNKPFYRSIKSLLQYSKRLINKRKYQEAKTVLLITKEQIQTFTPTFIDSKYSQIMTSEIDTLFNSL